MTLKRAVRINSALFLYCLSKLLPNKALPYQNTLTFAVSFRCGIILEMIIYVIIGNSKEGVESYGESAFFSCRFENQ